MQSIYLMRMQNQMALEVKETEAGGGNPTSACPPVRTVFLMIQREISTSNSSNQRTLNLFLGICITAFYSEYLNLSLVNLNSKMCCHILRDSCKLCNAWFITWTQDPSGVTPIRNV